MQNSEAFSATIRKNLDTLALMQSQMQEKRICELSDFAAQALDLMDSLELDIVSLLLLISEEDIFNKSEPHALAMSENTDRLSAFLSALNESDKLLFISLLFELAGERGIIISEKDFLTAEKSKDETFTYVKNQYADEAYDVFADEFKKPRVFYSDSLRDAALGVANGTYSYCLLPFEEKGGVRLPTVEALLNQYDLKIVSVTPVFGPYGLLDLKYALVSKTFSVEKIKRDDDRYLEIRLPSTSSLSRLTLAAEDLGFKLYRVNTLALMEESAPYFTVVFKGEGTEFTRLFAYLTLFMSEYTPIGIYTNLEQ